MKPFDTTEKIVGMFISMGDITGDANADVASEFVCRMYAQYKTRDVNEAHYIKMPDMSGKVDQVTID